MLAPKRVRRRKTHKGRMRGSAHRGSKVSFGEYGLMAMEPTWITNRQIESARVAMTRHIKGKGTPDGWVAVVRPGRIMFELEGISEDVAQRAMELAAAKLPIKCKFVVRERQL